MPENIKFDKFPKAYLFVWLPTIGTFLISFFFFVYFFSDSRTEFIYEGMNPLVSLSFIMYSSVLLLTYLKPKNQWFFYLAKVISVLLFFLSAITVIEHIFSYETPVSKLIMNYFPELIFIYNKNITFELGIVLLPLSLSLLLSSYRPNMNKLSIALNILVLVISLISLNGYFFDIPEFYNLKTLDNFDLFSALCSFLLALAGLFLKPLISYFSILMSKSSSGVFARRISVACLLLPPLLGKFGQFLFYAGMNSSFSFGIVAVLSLVSMLAIVWKSSTALETVDKFRLGSEQEKSKFISQMDGLLSEAPIGICFFNIDGSIIRANNNFIGFFLKDAKNFYDIHFFDQRYPKDLNGQINFNKDKNNYNFEIEIQNGNTKTFLSVTLFRIQSSDNSYSAVGCYCTDITHLKEIQSQLIEARDSADSANVAKSQFLANMSHEIRTPIGVIMGFSDLMNNFIQTIDNNKEGLEYIEVIQKNCRHLLNIIDDILDLSKVEAGKYKLHLEEISPKEIIDDLKATMEVKVYSKDIQLEFNIDERVPKTIISDNSRIRQVILNLCNNAIKFTKKGIVKLSCNYDNGFIRFTVEDRGCGIPQNQLEKLFKPFSQVDSSATREFGGNGLGLALSQKLARLLGGDIYIEKTIENVGSVFVAYFKDESNQENKNLDVVNNERLFNKCLNNNLHLSKKILVVDDSPDNRLLISHVLKSHSYQVTIAKDGYEGLDLVAKNTFDLILLDLHMPGIDGYETAKRLREIGYSKPIIALTADAMSGVKEKCIQNGFTNYLTKPINKSKLLEAANY